MAMKRKARKQWQNQQLPVSSEIAVTTSDSGNSKLRHASAWTLPNELTMGFAIAVRHEALIAEAALNTSHLGASKADG
jgi:hypothetical protein